MAFTPTPVRRKNSELIDIKYPNHCNLVDKLFISIIFKDKVEEEFPLVLDVHKRKRSGMVKRREKAREVW